jgi:PAS domain S-box-containing protein
MPPTGEPPYKTPWGLIIAIVILFIAIVAAGVLFYQSQEQQVKDQVTSDLTAIAKLKADNIVVWREDRLFDARVISAGAFFTEGSDHFLTYGDNESREKILIRFKEMNASPHYSNAQLVDPQGIVHISLDPDITSIPPSIIAQVNASLMSGDPVLTDIYEIPGTHSLRLDVIAPLTAKRDGSEKPVGAVLLSINPDDFLYPLIQSWPVPSGSAETLLVEREGDHVLFLNELRHQSNTAFNLTIPVSQTDVPSVMAVLGKTGVFFGKDYRGVDVISVLEPIPGSPWFMVAKVDEEEAYYSWRSRAVLIIVLITATLTGAVILIGLIWQRRQKYYYRSLYTAQKEGETEIQDSKNFLNSIIEQSPNPIWISDEKGTLIRLNKACYEMLHITPEEVVGRYNIFEDSIVETQGKMPLVRSVFEEGESVNFDLEYDTKLLTSLVLDQSAKVFLNVTIFPVRDTSGRITNAVIQHLDFTERKQLEAVLRQSEQKFSKAFHSSPDVLILSRQQDGLIIDVNDSWEKVFGYSRDEVIGKTSQALGVFVNPDQRQQAISRLQAEGSVRDFEVEIRRKSGEIRKATMSVEPIELDRESCMLTILRDITERKRVEEALRESEKKFRDTILNLDEGFYSCTMEGVLIEHNPAFNRILGFEPDIDMRGVILPDFWQDTADRQEYVNELTSRGIVRNYIINAKKPGNEKIVVTANSHVVYDEKGSPGRIEGTFLDITEQKGAEERIKTSEIRYRRLFESARDGILIINQDTGRIIDANPFIETLLGYSPQEIIGKYLWDIGPFTDRLLSKIAFEELQDKKYIRYEDVPLETKHGQRIDAEFVSNIYPIENISVIQYNIRDVTERKMMERQRETLIKDLEQKNAELERFTYTVSHDLKSPLITIRGFATMLEDDALKGDKVLLKKDISRIIHAAETMQALLSDVLELSRIGRVIKPPERISFGTIVHEAVDLLAVPFAKQGVMVEIAPDLPDVNVDHARILEVMVNLIENSIRFFGDQTAPTIRIGVDMKGKTPVFFVQDNGIGIDPRYLERIFNLFERLDASSPGTGVGLTIVRRIIELHGGRIWAESEGPGKGTTFRFTLPVREEEEF